MLWSADSSFSLDRLLSSWATVEDGSSVFLLLRLRWVFSRLPLALLSVLGCSSFALALVSVMTSGAVIASGVFVGVVLISSSFLVFLGARVAFLEVAVLFEVRDVLSFALLPPSVLVLVASFEVAGLEASSCALLSLGRLVFLGFLFLVGSAVTLPDVFLVRGGAFLAAGACSAAFRKPNSLLKRLASACLVGLFLLCGLAGLFTFSGLLPVFFLAMGASSLMTDTTADSRTTGLSAMAVSGSSSFSTDWMS